MEKAKISHFPLLLQILNMFFQLSSLLRWLAIFQITSCILEIMKPFLIDFLKESL